MIDDPELDPDLDPGTAPRTRRGRRRDDHSDRLPSRPPRAMGQAGRAEPTERAEPVEPVEPAGPGWGDPFADLASLSDPEGRGAALLDPWPVDDPGLDLEGPVGAREAAAAPSSAARRGPLLLTLLRPWFDPRPGELRGAILLLSVGLAVSSALWFDASRRPQLLVAADPPVPLAPPAAGSGGAREGPGGVDGSDGWGLSADAAVPRGPVVHVSGAVERPGVVTVAERARVADAIDAVGGAMPDAQLDRLNLARIVEDGERIHVPRVGEDAPPPDEPASRGVLADGRIDLNAASQAELETLPGVGPARAQAIIAEREVRPFRVPGDLRRVPGIGEVTFQRLAPLVAVR